jgi:mannose-6-phosphate isomerase-like protein (cupin superfamily)
MQNEKSSVFDLKAMPVYPYDEREKNVFSSGAGFKTRIIGLPPGGNVPACRMETAIMFYVLAGEAEVTVDGEKKHLGEGHCLIGEPAVYSMRTEAGVKMLGVQISAGQANKKT